VDTAEAIAKLREKMGVNQIQFAIKLGVTVPTVSRYEHGRKPKEDVLRRLADLSEEAGAPHLRGLFQAMRRSGIASNVEKLSSAGAARRVPVDDLIVIMGRLCMIKNGSSLLTSGELDIDKNEIAASIRSWAAELEDVVAPYLTPSAIVSVQSLGALFEKDTKLRAAEKKARVNGDIEEANRLAGEIIKSVKEFNESPLSKTWRRTPKPTPYDFKW